MPLLGLRAFANWPQRFWHVRRLVGQIEIKTVIACLAANVVVCGTFKNDGNVNCVLTLENHWNELLVFAISIVEFLSNDRSFPLGSRSQRVSD